MKVLVIGHMDAVQGFALAGVAGRRVRTAADLKQALDAALADPTLGILLITEEAASLDRARVDALKGRSVVPLLVEIPGPDGPDTRQPSLSEVIRRTTGVRI